MSELKAAAQMAAWFLSRQQGCRMPCMKLMKLLYLAERTFMERYGCPASGDKLISTDHGPALGTVSDYMKERKELPNDWNEWISPPEGHEVSLTKKFRLDELGELSDASLEVLQDVWEEFGNMSEREIRDYTLENCPEWKNPEGPSLPIEHEELLVVLGREKKEAGELASEIRALQGIGRSLSGHPVS